MFKSGSVIISKSYNIYSNLAFEEWLYNNVKCTVNNCRFLLIWQNKPAVVIGKHQNPWLECNTRAIRKNNIDLARRNSGGGTVYHDMGNINLSFFTPRSKYNREENLKLICESLKKFNLNVVISERHDLLWENFKISGTASKLGRENSYHHCTLLLDVNSHSLHTSLHQEIKLNEISSKATRSIRSSVQNLKAVCPEIKDKPVIEEISQLYLKQFQGSEICYVDPTEEKYSGFSAIETRLRSWDWIYGKTPKFIIRNDFPIINLSDVALLGFRNLSIEMTIFHGKIETLHIEPSKDLSANWVINSKFHIHEINHRLAEWLKLSNSKIEICYKNFVGRCLNEVLLNF